MNKAEINKELEELRAQVAELTRTCGAETPEQQTGATDSSAQTTVHAQESTSTDVPKANEENESDFSSHIQELVDALEQELKETNPMTVLVIFALGILIGRILPR